MIFSRRHVLGVIVIGAITGGAAYLFKAIQTFLQPSIPVLSTVPRPISRTEWGARLPNHDAPNEYGFADGAWYVYPGNLADIYNTVVIHHTAISLSTNETMRGIQDLHMDTNGWADIGYHYGIDKDGVIYEGRDIHVRGASVAGHNTGVIGVAVMGNFEWDQPLAAQLTALQTLVNSLAETYSLTHLAGHREFNPESVCPGRNLALYLDMLARGAGLQRGTGGYVAPE